MLKRFFRKSQPQETTGQLPWEDAASSALEQAVAQAPVPGPLKNKVKEELRAAAAGKARELGHEKVTAEDLMHGMLSKMPTGMRKKIEDAIKEGPAGVRKLEEEMKGKN